MAKIKKLAISKYRSIDECTIEFQEDKPVVLFGQNNAGKSNIIRALSIIMGEQYPKTIMPEDNDFFMRDRAQPISITVEFKELLAGVYTKLNWYHDRRKTGDNTVFEGTKPDGYTKWPNNTERDDCIAVFIGTERNLSYQLSYSSKYTMLSKLMHRFHETLHAHEDVKNELELQFKKTKEIFAKISEFTAFSKSLKDDFCAALECWSYKLDIDFEAYNPLNFFHALRVQAKENKEIRTFEELGSGEQQILAMSFAHAYAKAFKSGFILAIEEPEAHLHPLAQKWLAEHINKMCADGLNIILSTHSPAFLNILNLAGMYLVYKKENVTHVKHHSPDTLVSDCINRGADKDRCNPDTILPFYAANITEEIMQGFFARAVVLVEGQTEVLALPIYLAACGCDTRKQGIEIIATHGKGSIPRYVRLFEAYNIPTFVVFDNDSDDDENADKRKEILTTVGKRLIISSKSRQSLLVQK